MRRIVISLTLLVLFDHFFRRTAGNARRMAELRARLQLGLGREPTSDELMRAWMEAEGYQIRGST
ncbi:MAG TPA: hypothetical protein VJU60_00965 [Thermoleophilaceae bacterium]|nr:hypothetical protein [Thermoleophilaceae bacterium]